jgi:hypothetical protein
MNPIVVALAIVLTFGFEAILYGADEFSPGDFPSMESRVPQVDTTACGGRGVSDAVLCVAGTIGQFFANIFGFVLWVATVIGLLTLWLVNLATLNVQGAHWLGRVMMGTTIAGSIGWAIAAYLRGVRP